MENNLTGKQLIERGVITNCPSENIAQHGVDLNLIDVEGLSGIGEIPTKDKTVLVKYSTIERTSWLNNKGEIYIGWNLLPGTYNVTFEQGCNIPEDQMLLIRQRSSLLRNGTILHSSVFDAGFKTDNIGSIMIVTHPIKIQFGARVAQIYAHKSNVVENLYEGQFQNDKQREVVNGDNR